MNEHRFYKETFIEHFVSCLKITVTLKTSNNLSKKAFISEFFYK